MSQGMWDYKNKLEKNEKRPLSIVRGCCVVKYSAYNNAEPNECRSIFSSNFSNQTKKKAAKKRK